MADFIPSLSGFFEDEEARFVKAFQDMRPENVERQRARLARDPERRDAPREISIPAWDDVIHLAPRLTVTREQSREYWQARIAGRPAELEPEVILELERRRGRTEAMRRSTQDEYAQSFGSALTAIDNVQDFAATVSILGRIALWGGQKLGLRAIPGIGTAKTAADVLNTALLVGQTALPVFAFICAGPRAALAAGLATFATRQAFKHTISEAARLDPKGTLHDLRPRGRITRSFLAAGEAGSAGKQLMTGNALARAIAIGRLLTVAQVTDNLWNVGISLGPIVGGIMEAAYGAERAARGEPVRLAPRPGSEEATARLRPYARDLTDEQLKDRQGASMLLYGAPLVHRTNDVYTFREHALAIAMIAPAVELLRQDFERAGFADDWPPINEDALPAPQGVAHGPGWWELERPGTPESGLGWPQAAGAATIGSAELLDDGLQNIVQHKDTVLDKAPSDDWRGFLGACIIDATDALWSLYLSKGYRHRQEITTDTLLWERLAEAHLIPNPGNDEGKTWAFWTRARALIEQRRANLTTRQEWEQLAAAQGVDLVYMKPLDPTIETPQPTPTT